ncbi:MAG: rhomboid family intramembrane serine protease, partial [Gammaproteobacteria bacterium]
MLILPYSTALRLNQIPYVTFTIMVLCLVIFFFQIQNRNVINNTAQLYCELIKNTEPEDHTYDVIPQDNEYCLTILLSMHSLRDVKEWRSYFLEYYTADNDLEKYITYDLKHYSEFVAKGVPADLDTKLMYYPFSFNPFKMLTSALSHTDWEHIIFNLIFFFAFTPAIEILVGNKLKFIGVLVSIELIGGIMYSILSLINNSPIPTLGLSGSVMGMIGFSAYMMPKASIRTVFWFSFYIRKLFIPVWVLAIWFIGWDIFDLFIRTEDGGGTNFVAHVSGGISGYLIARFFFKDRRDLVQDELDDEIDRSRASRQDTFARMTSFIGDRKRIDEELQGYQTKKDQAV